MGNSHMLRCIHCEYCQYDNKKLTHYCIQSPLRNMFAWLIGRKKVSMIDEACENIKIIPGNEKYR